MECLAKQKADIEEMQRRCPCGGRNDCECRDREAVDDVIAYLPVREKEQEEKDRADRKELEEWRAFKAEEEDRKRKKMAWDRKREEERMVSWRREEKEDRRYIDLSPPHSPER